MKTECETQFLTGDITLTFQQQKPTLHLTGCQEESIEKDLNTFCRNFNNSDRCKFTVSDFMDKYEDCLVFSKKISVTYQCISKYFSFHVDIVNLHCFSGFTLCLTSDCYKTSKYSCILHIKINI